MVVCYGLGFERYVGRKAKCDVSERRRITVRATWILGDWTEKSMAFDYEISLEWPYLNDDIRPQINI
jgi:hypothetical protein